MERLLSDDMPEPEQRLVEASSEQSRRRRRPPEGRESFRRIGLYSAYLSTLGGGENFLGVLTELLEQEFPDAAIDIITYEQFLVPLAELTSRFGVTLRRSRIRCLRPGSRSFLARIHPFRRLVHEHQVAKVSEEYDLFVNNTIYSLASPRSPLSWYMCMFPIDPKPPGCGRVASCRACSLRMARCVEGSSVACWRVFTDPGELRVHERVDPEAVGAGRSRSLPTGGDPGRVVGGRQAAHHPGLGRFFPGDHTKRHDILIEMMARLWEEGLRDWELHLVGGRTRVPGTNAYIARLERLAKGLPVVFHLDASRESLEALLLQASLFWHATGFGENEQERPEKLEHFGLSTVEAMSYGCVPLVYASGGQPEIIEQGESGFLWRSLDELANYSRRLIQDAELWRKMSRRAHERSQRFSREAFRAQVRGLLAEWAAEADPGAPSGSPDSVENR